MDENVRAALKRRLRRDGAAAPIEILRQAEEYGVITATEDGPDIETLSRRQLARLAAERGLDYTSRTTRSAFLDMLG